MSDHQRRLFCRMLFFALCAAPTMTSIYWMCHPQTPQGWAQAIKAELGIETQIGEVETPGPYATELRYIRLSEGQAALFQTVEAQIRFGNQLNQIRVPYDVTPLENLSFAKLAKSLQSHLARTQAPRGNWRIEFDKELIVYCAGYNPDQIASGATLEQLKNQHRHQLVVSDLRIDLNGSRATAYFNTVDSSGRRSDTVTIEIESGDRPLISLKTRGVELPLWIMEGLGGVPRQLAVSLGDDATFRGRLDFNPEMKHLEFLAGEFRHVSVAGYEGENMLLGGEATIEIKDCEFVAGEFVRWEAYLSSPELPHTRIDEDTLFVESQQVALRKAIIDTAIQSRARLSRNYNTDSR